MADSLTERRRRAGFSSKRALYVAFALATVASALGNLSQTAVNAMISSMMPELGVAVDLGQWLTTGYMLTLGITVPAATFLMRRITVRTHMLVGIALFAAGSLIDLVAASFGMALAGRILQAVSVGLLMPLMQTMAITYFPPGRQATAMGVAGIAMGFAPNIGPTVGGALDVAFGWRSFFVLLLATSAALGVLTLVLVKRGQVNDPLATFDVPSFILSALGAGGILLGLSFASSHGIASPTCTVPIACGIVFCVLFVRRQRRIDQPLIHLDIFSSRRYVIGAVAGILLFASYMGPTLVIPLYVVGLKGGTSLDAGMVMFPATFTALAVNPLAGIATDRWGARPVVVAMAATMAVGAVGCALVGADTSLAVLTVFQTIRSIGVSGLIGPIQAWSLQGLAPRLVGDGSSTAVLLRQVAASFGTAIMVLVVTTAHAAGLAAAAPYQLAFGFSAVLAVALLVFSLVLVRPTVRE